MKILIFITLLLLITPACLPEQDFNNPIDYADYITNSSDQYPAVSPDGTQVAYFHLNLKNPEPEDYPTGLYIMNIDGTNRKLLLKGGHFQPDWAPDGKRLVFSSLGVIRIIDIDTEEIRTFEGIDDLPLFFPDWSVDGKHILFSCPYVKGGGGFKCTPLFEQVKQIYSHYQFNAYPSKWLSDSKLIGVSFANDWSAEEICIVDTTLTYIKRLTFNDVTDRDPTVSNDGKIIAWSSKVQIHTMNIDGSNIKRLDYGQYPAWTPDGKWIVYSNASPDFKSEVLWKIGIDGKNKSQLTF